MRRIILGGLVGAVSLPILVLACSALLHWLRFGNWIEFWGLILAIRAIPFGFFLGAILAPVLLRKR